MTSLIHCRHCGKVIASRHLSADIFYLSLHIITPAKKSSNPESNKNGARRK